MRRIVLSLLVYWAGAFPLRALTVLTYNVSGNGSTDWSTNAPQVRAIGRQMMYLQPDIITFNEVPLTNSWQMTNFVTAFLPGYFVARNSGTDGFIRSVILSRFPIRRSQKWLDGALLTDFGVDARFARDLFEAEILVPEFSEPLHVFTTHLKALSDAENSARRGAEAGAVSNFFVKVFLPAFGQRPYVLTGDFNEDVNRPPGNSHRPVQQLANDATGLRLTTPTNTVTGSERTFSARTSLSSRLDYILPCALLFSNIATSQVFRTDLLLPTPAGLEKFDNRTASDHLPVLMEFRNPYMLPFHISKAGLSNHTFTLTWTTQPGVHYDVQSSINFKAWENLTTNLAGDGGPFQWSIEAAQSARFFRVFRAP